jgi:hypothetical protein
MLLDASDKFKSGSSSADEAARAITQVGLLGEAIETCTKAARQQQQPRRRRQQQRLRSSATTTTQNLFGD